MAAVRQSGHYRPGMILHFRVSGQKLNLIARTLDETDILAPGDPPYGMFDLVACSAA
jgi:hypothetical protein